MSGPSEEATFGLRKSTRPEVRVEAGHVIVRLELASLRDPADEMVLSFAIERAFAEHLAFELLENAKKLP